MSSTLNPKPGGLLRAVMPEIAIVTTLALIAAPIALVAGALAAAAKKRMRKPRR